MLPSSRTIVIAGVAALIGIVGLSYELAGAVAPADGPAAKVQFSPDDKLKRPPAHIAGLTRSNFRKKWSEN